MSSEDVKREEAAMREALEAVKARGVDLTAALTPHNGRKASMADLGVWQDAPSPEPYGALLWQAMAAREEDRFNEAHRALRAEDARRARAKTEPQPERVPMLEVTIDLKHEEHVKRASAMLRNVAKNAYQETRPGATSLAVWALRQSDAAAVDRLKSELPEGVVTVR